MDVTKLTFEGKTKYLIQKHRGEINKRQTQLLNDLELEINNLMLKMSTDHNLGYDPTCMIYKSGVNDTYCLYLYDRLKMNDCAVAELAKDTYVPDSKFKKLRMITTGIRINLDHANHTNDTQIKFNEYLVNLSKLMYYNRDTFDSYFTNVYSMLPKNDGYVSIGRILDTLENSLKELDSY